MKVKKIAKALFALALCSVLMLSVSASVLYQMDSTSGYDGGYSTYGYLYTSGTNKRGAETTCPDFAPYSIAVHIFVNGVDLGNTVYNNAGYTNYRTADIVSPGVVSPITSSNGYHYVKISLNSYGWVGFTYGT